MSTLSIVLVVAGVALVALGLSRARAPWGRYQALRAQEANAERYRAWRGGPGLPAAAARNTRARRGWW